MKLSVATLKKISVQARSSDLVYVTVVVIIWRILVEVYAIFVLHRFPFTDTISHPWYPLTVWYNYDGHHFVSIAQRGYDGIQYAFFPLYPLLIKLTSGPFTAVLGDRLSIYIAAGLVIATLSLIGACWFILQLSKKYFDASSGKRAIFLLLFFPSAIFLASVYSESVFLLGVTGAFYFSTKRQWLLAGLFGAIAAGTRLVGIFVLPCLLIEFFLAYKRAWREHIIDAVYLLFVPASLGLYMAYQWMMVGNPFYFLEAQQAWGRRVGPNIFTDLWPEIEKGFNVLDFNAERIAPLYDGLAALFGLIMSVVVLLKRHFAFGLFMLMMVLVPLSSGATYSMIRFVLVLFPAFMVLGWWGRHQAVYSFLLTIGVIYFAILSIHFLNTWWLA